jgi:hypothetical protein
MGAEKLVRSYLPLPAGELLAHCRDLEIYCKGEVRDYFSFFSLWGGGGVCYLCTYDFYGPVRNVFDARSMSASGRALGPGNQDFLGSVKMHRAFRQEPCGAQKSRDF